MESRLTEGLRLNDALELVEKAAQEESGGKPKEEKE